MPGAGADDLDDPARLPQRAQHVRPHHRPLDRQVRPRLQPRPRQHLRPLRREEHGTPPGEESGCCIHVRRDEEKRKCPMHGEIKRDFKMRVIPFNSRLLPQSPSYQHTRGATPRHFQFDPSGEWLIVANQDTDNIGIFHFSLSTGWLLDGSYSCGVVRKIRFWVARIPPFAQPRRQRQIQVDKTFHRIGGL